MARRKKSSSGGGWAILLFGVLFLISKVPVEIWVSIGVLGVVGFVIYSVSKSGKPSQPSAPPPAQDQSPPQARRSPPLGAPKTVSTNRSVAPAPAPVPAPAIRATVPTPPASGHRPLSPPPSATPASSASSKNDELLSVRPANSGASSTSPVSQRDRDFKLPPAPMGMGAATWIQPSTLVPHAGAVIPGGLFYFGTNLPGLGGSPDPSLVNPSLSVAATGDYAQDQLGYWPSYSQMTPAARRAYINWLVGKRSDPRANIGFVFVFFYGLERRALVDATNDDKALSDLPTIAAEVQRLLNIYGEQSQSFRRYATNLLDWVSVARTDRLYTRPTPTFEQTFELPFHLRLALGQAVRDGAPIPGHLGTVCKTSSAQ